MKTVIVSLVAVVVLSALVVAPSLMAQQPNKSNESPSGEAKKDAQAACIDMMQAPG